MKLRSATLMILVLALALLGACGGDDDASTTTTTSDQTPPPAAQQAAGTIAGNVVETMDASGYTYVMVEVDGEQVWAAGPQTKVNVGDAVTIATGMPMPKFHSEALDRTFDTLYFVNDFGSGMAAPGHGGMGGMGAGAHPINEPGADVDLTGIERAEGGKTVAEVYAEADALAGQKVRVQGKVVKYNVNIMDRNWIHVRDGSGAEGANDLTVTTQNFAKVGDLVVIEGTLAKDRDFGHGYKYDVIVEEAAVEKVRK
jgi:hypothetical protein